VPKPDASLSAVVVSGGKQYRVAPGDHILVDRLAAAPGSSVKLGRVLLLHNGDEVTIGAPAVEGVDVEARVLAHRRGPRIEVLRYKSKKRVRVHRGARADLTALEILAVGGIAAAAAPETKTAAKPATKARSKTGQAVKSKAGGARAAAKESEAPAPSIELRPARARLPSRKKTTKESE